MDGKYFVADAVALAVYLVAANPALTGIGLHEWIGLGVFVVFLVHCAMHAGWVADAVRGALRFPAPARIANLVLDALILVAFMTVTVSGVLVSGPCCPPSGCTPTGTTSGTRCTR